MSDNVTHESVISDMQNDDNYLDGPLHDDRVLDQLLRIDQARQQNRAKKALDERMTRQDAEFADRPTILARDLQKGMTIVEGRGRTKKLTKIDTIQHRACSSRGTHVNGSWCYEAHVPVEIQA